MKAGTGPDGKSAAQPTRAPLVRSLLRFPLYYKILLANAAIVAVVTLVCSVLSARSAGDGAHYAIVLAGGLMVSVLSNALILRLALSPLSRLEQAAARVQAGDLSARAESSDLADRNMERLTATFNEMLDSADAYRARLRDVAAHALHAQEEERKRIARELHDGIAQTLAALRVRMRVARNSTDSERDELLERLSHELGQATEEVRGIAMGLRPPALDMLGLAPAIEAHARTVAETAGMEVTAEVMPVEGLLDRDVELALYRIVQEALSNAARHSGAKTARVRLSTAARAVVATVEDDGRGFNVATEMSSRGLGLFGMQERGAYVGATVKIESEPGRGTRVRVTLPVGETVSHG